MPRTVGVDVPVKHGGRSTVTATSEDVRGRRSATPEIEGNVVMSMTRKRSRVMGTPVLFVKVRRMSIEPNVALLNGSEVKSRT